MKALAQLGFGLVAIMQIHQLTILRSGIRITDSDGNVVIDGAVFDTKEDKPSGFVGSFTPPGLTTVIVITSILLLIQDLVEPIIMNHMFNHGSLL